MTDEHRKLGTEVPEADFLEQTIPANPNDDEADPAPLSAATGPVSEGDWADQQQAIPLDDEPDASESDD